MNHEHYPSGLLTYGQEMVEFNFDPSVNQEVNFLRAQFAAIIDKLNDRRNEYTDEESKQPFTDAIIQVYAAYLAAYGVVA